MEKTIIRLLLEQFLETFEIEELKKLHEAYVQIEFAKKHLNAQNKLDAVIEAKQIADQLIDALPAKAVRNLANGIIESAEVLDGFKG